MLVGPSRTDRGWLGCPPRSISLTPPYQCTGTPRARDARHMRSAKTHVAGREPEHVRQEAGPSERRSHEFGPISIQAAPAPSPRSAPPISVPPHPCRTPQPPPGTCLGPSHHQVKRPNSARPPASRARLPPAWRPRTRPGLRSGPPPLGGARAPLRQQA